jgi:hypothetical protein
MKQPSCVFMLLVLACTLEVSASDIPQQVETGSSITAFPQTQIYPENIADPHRPTFMLSLARVQDTTLDSTSDLYGIIKTGARIGLFRVHPVDKRDQAFQLNLDIGFNGLFDADLSWDVIGWNGVYALIGQYRFNPQWAIKAGLNHISSHIGDEYIRRTGRERIDYTRQELLLGANWQFHRNWQVYAETGYGYRLSNETLQKPWRVQSGIQFFSNAGQHAATRGWYAALDLSANEERDYSINTTLQAGHSYYAGNRRFQAGIEMYDGQVQIGELFQEDTRYILLGFWFDI